MQKISFSMILRILSWCSTLFLYAYTNTFWIFHFQEFFMIAFFPFFIWGRPPSPQHLSWNGILYRVLKTLIKGSPCHQKRGLFWDFVVFSTSFWFFCEIWLPLGPWHLAIAHGNLVLALGPWHWHIEIYNRTMAFHDWKPKPWLSKSMVLLWIWYGFTWFFVYLVWNPLPLAPCNLPLALGHLQSQLVICNWPLALGPLALANGNLHQNHGISWLELETLTIEALVFLKWVCFWLMLAPLVWNSWPLTPCNLHFALGTWQSHLSNLRFALGYWPLAPGICN